MVRLEPQLSTGLPGLDRVLKGLMPGDNIVWQLGAIEDYLLVVEPYSKWALRMGKRFIHLRFAKHPPILSHDSGAEVHHVNPEIGFEGFLTQIHQVISQGGRGTFYLFDCLSDLATDWYSDQMLGNFFMLTCPYLFDLETVTYFALLRHHHSPHAITPITETTQLFLDLYTHKSKVYVYPAKVHQRSSPTMHMLHVQEGDDFVPVTESAVTSEVLSALTGSPLNKAWHKLDMWDRSFLQALEALDASNKDDVDSSDARVHTNRLLRMAVSRDERVLRLAEKHLQLSDVLEVGERMIGTGLIGGKSVGMLLSRAILKRSNKRWLELLEVLDSFFVASDVFYTYLVRNGCWWVRQKQRDQTNYLDGVDQARQSILRGVFPDHILQAFSDMLDYYGQSPIIVRSSSLLEDNFGNAFAGKYDSFFLPNQGSRHTRLADFITAVRRIYASTLSEKALRYRARRGLLDRDEQMALLVQRVSGVRYDNLFYPHVAGVGLSYNPYVWDRRIDPNAGMIRLVFGLGTRAVDRADDDYTRVIALNDPGVRPEGSANEIRQYAQRKVDILDLEANRLRSAEFEDVVEASPGVPFEVFTSRDFALERYARERRQKAVFPWLLTFEKMLRETDFVKDIREMLAIIEEAYGSPVDVEFTASFSNEKEYKIGLVQCRPLQVQGLGVTMEVPRDIADRQVVLRARGAVIGQSRALSIDRVIYVVPRVYGQLPMREQHSIARLIGQIIHCDDSCQSGTIMLIGPGRWGTSTPSLGVPVSFSEINRATVLCEVVAMREDLVPDVSLGTHFFNDIVEANILYVALFPDKEGNVLNQQMLEGLPNRLSSLVPGSEKWCDVVRVVDVSDLPEGRAILLHANTVEQEVLCHVGKSRQ